MLDHGNPLSRMPNLVLLPDTPNDTVGPFDGSFFAHGTAETVQVQESSALTHARHLAVSDSGPWMGWGQSSLFLVLVCPVPLTNQLRRA